MTIDEARQYAMSLPEVNEEPHHHFSSFRIRGKIIATVPPNDEHLHIFVPEEQRHVALTSDPQAYEKLWWGKKVVGLRVVVSKARLADIQQLLDCAWRAKAPKSLVTKS